MGKLYFLQLVLYLTLQCFPTSNVQSDSIVLDTSKVVAEFIPHVSVLDSINRSRYSVDELVPLIAKVATRFKKIFIQLDLTRESTTGNLIVSFGTANLLSVAAAAKYNCHPSTEEKIEVILYLSKFLFIFDECECFIQYKKFSEGFADNANNICNGTVTTILVERCDPLERCIDQQISPIDKNDLVLNKYKWGVVTSFHDYCNHTSDSPNLYWDPKVVLLEYENDNDMKIDLTQCKSYKESLSKPEEFIKKLHWTDRQKDYKINMSNLVASWKSRISDLSKDSFILLQAFDTYDIGSGGWWFLDYDPAYTNTSAFVFKEKIQVASEIDREEDPKIFDWLKEKIIFNVNVTGIVSKRDTLNIDIAKSGFCRVIKYERSELKELYQDLSVKTKNCVSKRVVIYSSNFKDDSDFNTTFADYTNLTLLIDLTKDFIIENFNPYFYEIKTVELRKFYSM